MKFRIIRDNEKFKVIVDPDGKDEKKGTFKTIQAAKSKIRSLQKGDVNDTSNQDDK